MKKSLIVGINNYPGNKGMALKGCLNDVARMTMYSLSRHQFSDTKILTDSKATVQNVTKELTELVSGSEAGDEILFYYSGHGSVIPDLSGDEEDMFDECLVLYDHHPDNAFTDDKLAQCIKGLHPEAYLTIILDSCHGPGSLESEMLDKSAKDFDFPEGVSMDTNNTRKFGQRPGDPSMQRHVLFAACGEGGIGLEAPVGGRRKRNSKTFGVFTTMLVRTLRLNRYRHQSWRKISRSVVAKVLRFTEGGQVPVISGSADMLDRHVFNPGITISEESE